MLVSSGRALVVSTSQLSNPMTAMSSGTVRPRSRTVSSTPRAIWSDPQTARFTNGRIETDGQSRSLTGLVGTG